MGMKSDDDGREIYAINSDKREVKEAWSII